MSEDKGKLPGRLFRAAVAVSACLNGAAWAVDEDAYFSEFPIVASVSRLPQRLADAPTAVTVVDREMIKASGARDLNDIFRLVPGFQTYPNTTEAARVSYHGLNDGDYAPRVQVLVDGRSMYSPLFGGGVNWATLPVAIENIERIEVVRGTNAVSYGSNAFLGVINIITVDPALTHGVSVSTSYGNQNVRDYSLRAGGKIGEVGDFRFTFRQESDSALANQYDWIDSYFTRLFDLRADFTINETDSLQFSAGQVEGVTTQGRIIPGTTQLKFDNPLRDMRQTDSYVQFVWRRALSSTSDIQLRYSYVQDQSNDAFTVALGPNQYYFNPSGDEGARHEFELQHSLELMEKTRLVWGASWRDDATRSSFSLPGLGTVHRQVSRVFGNVELKPVNWFTGNLGLAGEDDSLAGFHAMPRVAANFHLTPQNTVRLGYSRAYRTGSTTDFLGKQVTPVEYVFAGNPNLPPEQLDTYEIGYLGDWRDWRSSVDVRVFSEKVHDRLFKIDLGYGNPAVPSSTVPIQDVQIEGVEYQFKWQPFDATKLVLSQSFSHIGSEYLASALALPNSTLSAPGKAQSIQDFTNQSMPGRSTSILLMQKLPWGLEFSTAAYWQGKMKWSTNTSSPSYSRVDMRLGYPFRWDAIGGELAFTVQSLNGSHFEYKWSNQSSDYVVDRREWVSLRLDF